jgi:hypothetical protein
MGTVSNMKTRIVQVGQIGASDERGWIFSTDGVMATITATCYKGPPMILTNISSTTKLNNKEGHNEPTGD